jgi:hypothetical protein
VEKKANHQVNIVRVPFPRVHTNADTLEIFEIGGYQLVAKKGGFTPGDLAVYLQPDSVVPQSEAFKFIWETYVGIDGVVPERRRRITVKKLRGEWSEGLLMPVIDFPELGSNIPGVPSEFNPEKYLTEGDDVSDLLNITHYDPDAGRESTTGLVAMQPRRRYPKTVKGWFFFLLYRLGFKKAGKSLALETNFNFPVYDVEALKNFKNVIQPGERVYITEKIHGSNARFVFIDGVMYAGSRTQWKQKGDNIWWKAIVQHPKIEEWCIAHEGWVLYGEVVPTQGKGFDYGFSDGEVGFFAFDVLLPNGAWVWPESVDFAPTVPLFGAFAYDDDLLALADGNTLVSGAKHIREGIVIRSLENCRVHLKVVSNRFLEQDGKN